MTSPLKLRPAELIYLDLISQGYSCREVAVLFSRSHRTVEAALQTARDRNAAANTTHLVRLWVERGPGKPVALD